jgi:hypothetical protein
MNTSPMGASSSHGTVRGLQSAVRGLRFRVHRSPLTVDGRPLTLTADG